MKHSIKKKLLVGSIASVFTYVAMTGVVLADNWEPIKDTKILNNLFSDSVFKTKLKEGVEAVANFKSDGTGELNAWGETYARTWQVKDNAEVCVGINDKPVCFTLEKDTEKDIRFRAKNLKTNEVFELSIEKNKHQVNIKSETTNEGGAAKPSAAEVAAKLANPNTALASLIFKFQYRQFAGDLPNAADQSGLGLIFQPVLPFPLDGGNKIIFRPAIPLQFSQPVFDSVTNDFESESGLGDIGFDLIYAPKAENGLLLGYGVFSILPTATEDSLGLDVFALGPELLIGKLTKKHVFGTLASYAVDVGGPSDADFASTTMSAFYVYLPGNGWNFGSAPIMSYDHENDQGNIPLNFNFGKTVIWGGRPWKLSMEFNYFIEKPDSFAQDWFIGINIVPVVENGFTAWFN